jgi:hypothetical protein
MGIVNRHPRQVRALRETRAEGGIFVNPSGNPHLAQGGSGG